MPPLPNQPTVAFPIDLLRTSVLRPPLRRTIQDSWHGHLPFAFWCVEALAPRVLVELGCHKGDSYCTFCQAVDELSADTRCYAVDTWRGDPLAGYYGEEIYEELRQYHDPRYGRFSRLLRSTFDEALSHFPDATVDLLHIDGSHAYEDVRHDFVSWLPKISPTGVVLFHDIEVREAGFGVWRFWEEVRGAYPSFSFSHSHGLGVLAVGADPPEALRRLTSLDDGDVEVVRSLFGRLGDAVRYESAVQALARQRERIAELEAAQKSQAASLHDLEAAYHDLEAAYHDLEAGFHDLEAGYHDLEAGYHDLEAAYRNLDAWYRNLEVVFREGAERIAFLNAERDAFLRSASWRVSAPLRFAGRLLRRP